MTRVVWDDVGQRLYRAGIDRGMLYTADAAVPWNGLASVTESPNAGAPTAVYLDGQKVLNVPGGEDFQATISTYAAPAEFAPCAGRILLQAGMYATEQPKETFWFSYRTLNGNDVDDMGTTYRVHVVANALATIGDFVNSTINDNSGATLQSWSITTTPIAVPGMRPTSHFVFDTRLVSSDLLHEIEAILYGDQDGNNPRIPTTTELALLLTS
jgi:hypothetical protein